MNCTNCGNALRAGLKFCPACGTPAQSAPAFGATPEQMQTSWGASPQAAPRRKSRAGKILLIVFGVFLVLAVGAGVAVYFGIRYFADTVKSSEPYRLAEGELRANPKAAEVLGEIKSTGFPIGAFDANADGTGQAAFTMSVEGTKASGHYVVTLERKGGAWRVANASLRLSDGRVVNLLGEAEGADPSAGVEAEGVPPPPPAPGGRPLTVRVPGAIDGGALDDKARSKPAPAYPAAARAARATGRVVVQVTVDESGRVILASAASGHPLLRPAAEAAARQARFEPTMKDGKPVKVVGTLSYDFK